MKANFFLAIVLLINCKAFAQPTHPFILSMVHNNPGEAATVSSYNDPQFLKQQGYTAQVINDFTFAHAALTFDKLNPAIFPEGSVERKWVMEAANKVRENIKKAHDAGLKAYYFTDIIVLPKSLIKIYHDEICDAQGRISFERPKTIEIHKLMFDELFETFPDLDGLVIRTGETYLNNVPYHSGNNPITNGPESHIKLLNLLREEVCEKYNKMVFYRTWSFGGMHDDPDYYLKVVNSIKPHPNLIFCIKHTQGDFHRTYNFNPTIGLGKHRQIVEIQCQREYEGKGAFPNYIMNGVINGFEEYHLNKPQKGYRGLNDIKSNPNFAGILSWARGGGWVGPYIKNEFWCKLNAYVIAHWLLTPNKTETSIFNDFMTENNIYKRSRTAFRRLCLLSAKAVIRGHESVILPYQDDWTWWMRDHFLAGISKPDSSSKTITSEGFLYNQFNYLYQHKLLNKAINEKYDAVNFWIKIVQLSKNIKLKNKQDEHYIKVSAQYGLLLQQIIANGWNIMALGFEGDNTGNYNIKALKDALKNYDNSWINYQKLASSNPDCATLYKPYAFVYQAPYYHSEPGMKTSVDKYRRLIQ